MLKVRRRNSAGFVIYNGQPQRATRITNGSILYNCHSERGRTPESKNPEGLSIVHTAARHSLYFPLSSESLGKGACGNLIDYYQNLCRFAYALALVFCAKTLGMGSELSNPLAGLYLHDAILNSCASHGAHTAIIDISLPQSDPNRSLSYSRYGEIVEALARGLVSRGIRPGDVIAIYLPNCWEFAAAYHAATLAAAIPTPLNPSYRERELRFQVEDSGARLLITDGALVAGMNLAACTSLTAIVTTRGHADVSVPFAALLQPAMAALPTPEKSTLETIAALPYSSGTTGMPKGVMLSHSNLVTNVFQFLVPGEEATYTKNDTALCCLPLYHIYGLNVVLNPVLAVGATLVLMPRFDEAKFLRLLAEERPTFAPLVPPIVNCLCNAAEQDRFPRDHRVRYVKSGAAPLAPEL